MLWNCKCEPDKISMTKQQYLISAEIQVKIVPNPALISSSKMACFFSTTMDFYGWGHEDISCLNDKSVDDLRGTSKRNLAWNDVTEDFSHSTFLYLYVFIAILSNLNSYIVTFAVVHFSFLYKSSCCLYT